MLPSGPLDAITDVAGVKMGNTTIRSMKVMWVPGQVPWHLAGRAASARHRGACRQNTATSPLACWCRPISAVSLRLLGLARTGSSASNGSGDYAIAFSTAPQVRIHMTAGRQSRSVEILTNDAMSPLFEAIIEATEEAVYNSMFRASTMSGNGRTVEALPIDRTTALLKDSALH